MTCFWRARERATRHTLPSNDGQTLPSTHLSGVLFAGFYRHILPKSLARNTLFSFGFDLQNRRPLAAGVLICPATGTVL